MRANASVERHLASPWIEVFSTGLGHSYQPAMLFSLRRSLKRPACHVYYRSALGPFKVCSSKGAYQTSYRVGIHTFLPFISICKTFSSIETSYRRTLRTELLYLCHFFLEHNLLRHMTGFVIFVGKGFGVSGNVYLWLTLHGMEEGQREARRSGWTG